MNTTTETARAEPWPAAIPRPAAMELAATEYQRVVALLRRLPEPAWSAPTDCPAWDVRQMAAHLLGMVEMAASIREQVRQMRKARRRGGPFLDALTGLQVDERREMAPAAIIDRYALRWPKAVAGRRHVPRLARRRPLPIKQVVGGREEPWTIGFLMDVILTRDPWMHRIDIARAAGVPNPLTAEHDGVLVADVVAEWAARHGRPYDLQLSGPAGGSWSSGRGGPRFELDPADFCRMVSGRQPADGLLATQVPF